MSCLIVPIISSSNYSGIPAVNLTSSPPVIDGTTCQPVTITCTIQELPSFAWFRDGATGLASYSYLNREVDFPITLYDQNGIVIQITHAVSESPNTLEFNATSVLTTTTSALDILDVNSIRCGSVALSQTIPVILNAQGTREFP